MLMESRGRLDRRERRIAVHAACAEERALLGALLELAGGAASRRACERGRARDSSAGEGPAPLCGAVELCLGPDAPLSVKYELEKSENGFLQFYLAPKVDE